MRMHQKRLTVIHQAHLCHLTHAECQSENLEVEDIVNLGGVMVVNAKEE